MKPKQTTEDHKTPMQMLKEKHFGKADYAEKRQKKSSLFSEKQKKILIAGIVIIFLMGLFPPWLYTFKRNSIYSERTAGYSFIMDSPTPKLKSIANGIKLDFSKLFLQWFLVVIATGLGIYLSKKS